MQNSILRILFALILTLSSVILSAEKLSGQNNDESYFDLSLEENIALPVIAKKDKTDVKSFQKKNAETLLTNGQRVETMRNGEVLVATIDADMLFAPNDTVLLSTASNKLMPFSTFMKIPGIYKVLIVMHSDNTGSEDYTYHLTESRINAVYSWFEKSGCNTSALIPYAMGDSEPLKPNNSRLNRNKNRRLEIYIIPDNQMQKIAKKYNLH